MPSFDDQVHETPGTWFLAGSMLFLKLGFRSATGYLSAGFERLR
jgi:hypothetical protein